MAEGTKRCIIGRLIDDLDDDRDDLLDMLDRPIPYSARLLSQALTQYGRPVGKDAILKHRQETCSCLR